MKVHRRQSAFRLSVEPLELVAVDSVAGVAPMDWLLADRVVLALVDGLFRAIALPSPRSVRLTVAALVRAP